MSSNLIQVLPTHKTHPETFADVLGQMGYSNVRVTKSRSASLSPSLIILIQCSTCKCVNGLNLNPHLVNPRAPLLALQFVHAKIGCNVVPAGVITHPTLPRTLADELARALIAGPSSSHQTNVA